MDAELTREETVRQGGSRTIPAPEPVDQEPEKRTPEIPDEEEEK